MQIRSRLRRAATFGAALLTLTLAATAAEAQGKGRGGAKGGAKGPPPGQVKKHVSTGDAVVAVREVLVVHGYNPTSARTVQMNIPGLP